mmetsp:Transcript_19768/g.29620  ORF Transcript_19768/g.29620 Transcript_19768/m.29620 type:complete len:306 (-) Transcript_19768:35-952(-)
MRWPMEMIRGSDGISLLLLLASPVDRQHEGVITMVGLESQLFLRLAAVLAKLVHFRGEDGFGGGGGVDAAGLDGDEDGAVVLQEVGGVVRDDTSLIRLGDIREDNIDHADQHSVPLGLTGVLDDRDDVRSALGHVCQVSAASVGEFNGVDDALRANHVRDVRDGGAGGASEVEDLGAGFDRHSTDASDDTGTQLRSERVPNAVLDLLLLIFAFGHKTLLTVDGLPRYHVLGDQRVVLTLGNEDALVSVGFDHDLVASSLLSLASLASGLSSLRLSLSLHLSLALASAILSLALSSLTHLRFDVGS